MSRSHAQQAAELRRVLADGNWHSGGALSEVVGRRYGARAHEVRRGSDGGVPMFVECQMRDGESYWRMRAYAEGETPPPQRPSRQWLESEVERLRGELERIKGRQPNLDLFS